MDTPHVGLPAAPFRALDHSEGLFLVLRHHPGWGERARRLIEGVTARLARNVPDWWSSMRGRWNCSARMRSKPDSR